MRLYLPAIAREAVCDAEIGGYPFWHFADSVRPACRADRYEYCPEKSRIRGVFHDTDSYD
jgi:hypothetical protein